MPEDRGPHSAPHEKARHAPKAGGRGIGKHLIGRHGKFKRLPNVAKSKPKNGTCAFNCLATANCTIDGSRAFLAIRLVWRVDDNADVVAGLIRECRSRGVMIRSLKADREFFSTSVTNMLDAGGIEHQMPAVKATGVKRAAEEFREGKGDAASRHSIKSADGTRAEFTRVILKLDKGRFFTLATGRTVQCVQEFRNGDAAGAGALADECRIRRGMETACKDYESIRPRTTSSDESMRILLMLLPTFLLNAWVLAKSLLEKQEHGLTLTLKGLINRSIRWIKDFGLEAAAPTGHAPNPAPAVATHPIRIPQSKDCIVIGLMIRKSPLTGYP